METSIKLVEGWANLSLGVKRIRLDGEVLDSKQLQSVCSEIGKRYNIPAVPFEKDKKQDILIPAFFTLPGNTLHINDWLITPSAALDKFTLFYRSNFSKQLIADLYKRALLLKSKSLFWTLDTPRILYEKTAFHKAGDVAVIRRFEVSEVIVDEGLGFSVGLTTSFFSTKSALDYFENGQQDLFNQVTNRQAEQQGTLLYKGPRGNTKCYFVKYGYSRTMIQTPSFSESGVDYANSYEYYRNKFPKFDIKPTDKVAMVSFPGMTKQVYVAAKFLFPRIFNSSLQPELQNIDKIGTNDKKQYIENNFWKKVGEHPFGSGFAKISTSFFRPPNDKSGIIPMPALLTGKKIVIAPPSFANRPGYRDHFKNRKSFLDKYGCYYIPPTLSGSKIYFVFPEKIPPAVQTKFSEDITAYLKQLTRNEAEFEIVILPAYQNYLQATVSLKNDHEHGMVVFIFDDADPATYSLIDFELKGWSLKRATSYELLKKHRATDKALSALHMDQKNEKILRDWDSYIEMNALDIIQKLNCIPYIVPAEYFHYDMQIVIDVSEDFSHFCISGMMFKKDMPFPHLPCHTERKTDGKKETINPQILKDELVRMFTSLKKPLNKYACKKYLFARDGKDCGEEFASVKEAFELLIKDGVIPADSTFDFVEYHKTTRKEVRIWQNQPDNTATNVLEGSYYFFRQNIAIMCTTGDATLSSRVTADPITIVNKYTNADILKVITDIFYGAQLNYSNPRVAQKHSLPMKRADDELSEKRAQEIKRIK